MICTVICPGVLFLLSTWTNLTLTLHTFKGQFTIKENNIENNFNSCYIETMSFMKAAQKLYLKKGFKFINKPLGNTGHKNCNIWMLKHF